MTPERRSIDEMLERVELVSRKVDAVAKHDLRPLDLQTFDLTPDDLTNGKLNDAGREKVRVFFDRDIQRHDHAFARMRMRADGDDIRVWDLDILATEMMEAIAFEPTNRITNNQLRVMVLMLNNVLGKMGQLAETLQNQHEMMTNVLMRMIERAVGGDEADPDLDAVLRVRPPKDAH
jgi:hypothetical protein